jgi:hypothetical protein
MKLAMRVGRHYRLKEILPRHFVELAKACRFPADTMLAMLKELSGQLPDEGLAAMKEIESKGMARGVLVKLLDGLASQCQVVNRNLPAS